jgi:hypothetical protein
LDDDAADERLSQDKEDFVELSLDRTGELGE